MAKHAAARGDAPRAPALFLGHGSPMNALELNAYTRTWRELGEALPTPKAILCISAHWFVRGLNATANAEPPTIHDFYGFPPQLYAARYPAPGAPALVEELVSLLAPQGLRASLDWGLDHGTWSVLVHLYPDAQVPVVQLSIDATRPAAAHLALGRALSPLREAGVLLLGSGNVVHNLARMVREPGAAPYDWALEFEARVRDQVLGREYEALANYADGSAAARLSVPTPEHYLPLLYVLGAAHQEDELSIPLTGIELGSISMMAVLFR